MSNNCYIKSIEASEIYNLNYRDGWVKGKYVGMMPDSLTLRKLCTLKGFKTKKIVHKGKNGKEDREKFISNNIINVKFKQNVKSAEQLLPIIDEKLAKINHIIKFYNNKKSKKFEKKLKYQKSLSTYKTLLHSHLDDWKEIKAYDDKTDNDLRHILYNNGFNLFYKDEETGEVKDMIHYRVWQRSSAKSRVGQVLFISDDLCDAIVKWQRLDIPFPKDKKIDFCSLLAYESLVSSSIIDTIKIPAKNIFIVKDIDSRFNWRVDKVIKDENGHLINQSNIVDEVSNCLFDGESLGDKSLFDSNEHIKGKGFALLRNRMFKSAMFNTNLQYFLKCHCPIGIKYKDWQLPDMFNNMVYAKDILLVCTPSSLKALKFSEYVSKKKKKSLQERDIYKYWKKKIAEDDFQFGICKYEKVSGRGTDFNTSIVNQMSYQMLNSIQMKNDDMSTLCNFEKDYLNGIQDDKNIFIEHLKTNANDINSNNMIIDLFNWNPDVLDIEVIRNFKYKQLFNYKEHLKKGKIRLNGDYVTMCGNGLSMLYHTIGKFDVDNPPYNELKNNEISTTQHEYNHEYCCFRNPHTSPSNVYIAKNVKNREYNKYFNATNNIVFVGAIKYPLQDTLSGCDYDSDNFLIINSDTLLSCAHAMLDNKQYRVVLNGIDKSTNKYFIDTKSMADIDGILSESQSNIGTVVNDGQLFMSYYWDELNKTSKKNQLYFDYVQICTVLSAIAIDNAKRHYSIDDIGEEIEYIESKLPKVKKPTFFKYVGKNTKEKKNDKAEKYQSYDSSMEYLQKIIKSISTNRKNERKELYQLLVKPTGYAGRNKDKIFNLSKDMVCELNYIEALFNLCQRSESDEEEKFILKDECLKKYKEKISKLKCDAPTMYEILKGLSKADEDNLQVLNILYHAHKNVFLSCFTTKIAEKSSVNRIVA